MWGSINAFHYFFWHIHTVLVNLILYIRSHLNDNFMLSKRWDFIPFCARSFLHRPRDRGRDREQERDSVIIHFVELNWTDTKCSWNTTNINGKAYRSMRQYQCFVCVCADIPVHLSILMWQCKIYVIDCCQYKCSPKIRTNKMALPPINTWWWRCWLQWQRWSEQQQKKLCECSAATV